MRIACDPLAHRLDVAEAVHLVDHDVVPADVLHRAPLNEIVGFALPARKACENSTCLSFHSLMVCSETSNQSASCTSVNPPRTQLFSDLGEPRLIFGWSPTLIPLGALIAL